LLQQNFQNKKGRIINSAKKIKTGCLLRIPFREHWKNRREINFKFFWNLIRAVYLIQK